MRDSSRKWYEITLENAIINFTPIFKDYKLRIILENQRNIAVKLPKNQFTVMKKWQGFSARFFDQNKCEMM